MKLREPWDVLQQTGDRSFYAKQQSKDKVDHHKQYMNQNGENIQEIRSWNRSGPN